MIRAVGSVRVLMFGRGVIASVYGWAFARAGHEVEFYVRPGRAADHGPVLDLDLLDLRRRRSGERVLERWPVRHREELAADDKFDLVVLSVAHNRLSSAASFLAPRIGTATVLVLGNVAGNLEAAIAPLPPEQVVWGFPGAGGGFQPDGRLWSVLHRTVTLAAGSNPRSGRELATRRLLRGAGLRVREVDDLEGWLAIHLVLDAGMFSQGLGLGSLSELVGRRDALTEAFVTSSELVPALVAQGVDLRRHRTTLAMLRHPRLTGALLAWATGHVAAARISLAAHTDPRAVEPRAVIRDVLEQAQAVGVPAPRLEAAVRAYAR